MMSTENKFSPEVRQRAVKMVLEHQGEHESQWAAIQSVAAKIGTSGEALRGWVRQHERDAGKRAGATTAEKERIKARAQAVRSADAHAERCRPPDRCAHRAPDGSVAIRRP